MIQNINYRVAKSRFKKSATTYGKRFGENILITIISSTLAPIKLKNNNSSFIGKLKTFPI